MELALYCPVHGYYEKEQDIFGGSGDFYTSVTTGPFFGQLLAFQFCSWLESLPRPPADETPIRLVEAGAHDGTLANDILSWIREHRPRIWNGLLYTIVEPAVTRRSWQESKLDPFRDRLSWVSELPGDSTINGVIFSNELLDAFPVHRIGWCADEHNWFEWSVRNGPEGFVWCRLPLQDQQLVHSVPSEAELLAVLPDGFTIEACPSAESWWGRAARSLRSGRLLTLDYGLDQEERLAPERSSGTLRGYSRHRVNSELLSKPGTQDLTAHLNFTGLQTAGTAAGLVTEFYGSQSRFLTSILANGFAEHLDASDTRQFHSLTHPDHLGRSFRVLVQSRSVDQISSCSS